MLLVLMALALPKTVQPVLQSLSSVLDSSRRMQSNRGCSHVSHSLHGLSAGSEPSVAPRLDASFQLLLDLRKSSLCLELIQLAAGQESAEPEAQIGFSQ